MRRWLQYGGFAAGIVLIAFGAVAIAMGVNGRSTVNDSLRLEKIVGSPDMTPAAIKAEAKAAGLEERLAADLQRRRQDHLERLPARCFASYMRIHALEASGGLTYSEMPRFASADGKGTSDAAKAAKGTTGQPLDNPVRAVWVSETALSHRAQRQLHGVAARALRHRRRHRAAAERHRLHRARRLRDGATRRHGRAAQAAASTTPATA